MSVWAYLPVGPLERQFVGGNPGGFSEKRSMTDLQEGVNTFLGWDIFGEASANYILGCPLFRKVARDPAEPENNFHPLATLLPAPFLVFLPPFFDPNGTYSHPKHVVGLASDARYLALLRM